MSSVTLNVKVEDYVDIDFDEIVDELSTSGKKELMKMLAKELEKEGAVDADKIDTNYRTARLPEIEFMNKLTGLYNRYISISPEDLSALDDIFRKYL